MNDEFIFFVFVTLDDKLCVVFSASVPGYLIDNTNIPPRTFSFSGTRFMSTYLSESFSRCPLISFFIVSLHIFVPVLRSYVLKRYTSCYT